MQKYVDLPFGAHMEFLIEALDGDFSGADKPVLPPLSHEVDVELVHDAIGFLRRISLPIEPRKKWPDGGGMLSYKVSGNIPATHRAQLGMCLCVWGDAGWGGLVRQGKYRDEKFADELVAACVKMINEWNPQPAPTWVTCVPSLRHPRLVPDFADRLAKKMGLPFRVVLRKTDERPEQKTMANSAQQAKNIDGSLTADEHQVLEGPVFLVDDMVDSRWTLTVSTWLLCEAGSGEVRPIVLAETGHDQS